MTTTESIALTSIDSVTLEVADPTAARSFYDAAFDLGDRLRLRGSDAPTSGFRGYTLSLIVSQPSTVGALFDAAVAAGASVLKPVQKSLWGHGGSVQAPDGAIWKVATSAKKDTDPSDRSIASIVLLLGAEDVAASKRFYTDRGLVVAKSFGSYVDFAMPSSPIGLGLYKRRALAKDAGVAPEGTGSHRIVIGGVGIGGGADGTSAGGRSAASPGAFTDPDGFEWGSAGV